METKADIVALVDRGSKLAREVALLERKSAELNSIKAQLRGLAQGEDMEFAGSNGTVAKVEQKNDAVARVVPPEALARVFKLAGERLHELFTMHPSKGGEQNFALNVFKALPKAAGRKLIALLTVEATPWVRFS